MQFSMQFNYQKFALIEVKLTNSRKGNVYHVETASKKKMQKYQRYKLIFLIFFMETEALHRTLKKGKLMYFSLLLQL